MLEAVRGYADLVKTFATPGTRRLAVFEGNQDCNRRCSYCDVPNQYNSTTELTLGQTYDAVDWLYGQGYRLLSYLGGEPFAPFKTAEGITFTEHTLGVVRHAKSKGMTVNVTTNGDYVPKNPEVLDALMQAGLDSMTFSLHSFTKAGLERLIKGARMAKERSIVSTVQTVATSQTADLLPGIAAYAAKNGIFFNVGLVQVQGDGFAKSQDTSVIPSLEQQERLFRALSALKSFGFVKNNRQYLSRATSYFPNNWQCNPNTDTFIKIGAGGKLNVCSRVETGLTFGDVSSLDDPLWRERKREGVEGCGNCLFNCYFEMENADMRGDAPSMAVAGLIRSGHHRMAERFGRAAVAFTERRVPQVDWSLQLA